MTGVVGFIGVGAMGRGMARRLIQAGYQLQVCDRQSERLTGLVEIGAKPAATARLAAMDADFVITMVDNDQALRAVAQGPEGILAGLKTGAVFIQMATISLETNRTLAGQVRALGGDFIDAPVFGSRAEAAGGKLWIMVGGEADTYERCKPLLAKLGQYVDHFGPVGAGAAMKLCGNLLVAQMTSALAESLTLGRKAGLPLQQMLKLLSQVDFRSSLYDGVGAEMVARKFEPSFTVRNMLKDIRLIIEFGQAQAVPVPELEAAVGFWEEAVADGQGEKSISAYVTTIEKEAGLAGP